MMSGEYELIYPQLTDYWCKPLAEFPEYLHGVVGKIFCAHGWDAETVEQRQQLVRNHDWYRDPAQEAETWYALFLYAHADEDGLDVSALRHRIAEARGDKHSSVVLRLQDVADRLNGIEKTHDHWPDTEPLLWRELYRFSVVELKAMRSVAIDERDYSLELALKDVAEQLERILDIDRERVGDVVVAAIDAEIVQGVSVGRADGAGVVVKDATSKANDEPLPGRLPRTAVGKLAIKAAWEIECETKRVATVHAVIAKLQTRVDTEDALTAVIKNGVSWMTGGLKVKDFDIDACSKALKTWHSSRA